MNESEDAVTALSLARNLLAELDRRSTGLTVAVKRRMEREQKSLASSNNPHETRTAALLADGIDNMGWTELITPSPQTQLDL